MSRKKYNYTGFCNHDCFNCKFSDCMNPKPRMVPIPTKSGYFNNRQLKNIQRENRPQPASR